MNTTEGAEFRIKILANLETNPRSASSKTENVILDDFSEQIEFAEGYSINS